ncbi:uncharacterized protein PHALS_15328 [Plasmopara halstedii]|uniref:Uncharacterized protein n=1 Tax=Plasmopara halstedii TaxID=4781 RepID=A0A0N7L4H0_PLAHL|nr:uncharacterized protein PHALS_15328 [Plasmopara halstedii]CEG38651.1 hypothetical protein PHALS_15328 [Plasmopara halstedii]|eukprot:XP_024575020.1 hypothetical protein PHALS_15328 [Plasmopara halstedii]
MVSNSIKMAFVRTKRHLATNSIKMAFIRTKLYLALVVSSLYPFLYPNNLRDTRMTRNKMGRFTRSRVNYIINALLK